MREEEREKINRCLVVSLTNATSSRGPLAADNKMHDLPFRLLERLAMKAQQRQLREECARKRERETRITREEERYIYIPSHDDVTKGDPRYIRATGRRHEL